MTFLVPIAQMLNILLSNNTMRFFVLMVTSVYTGYTLYPVPKFLDELFYSSDIFKYLTLMFLLSTSMYPVTSENIYTILLIPGLVLLFFKLLRKYDTTRSLVKMYNAMF